MTQSLLAKLDELQAKVSILARNLEQSRLEQRKNQERAEQLSRENEQLRKKVELAQEQVDQMLGQWFPELELTGEK
jgi:uncharacterized alpha-E superfamily protein